MSQPVHGLHDQGEVSVEDYRLVLGALRESEERVRLILASAAEAIFGCDPVGTCIFCNDAAARVLGYDDAAQLVGKNMHATEHHTRADGTPYPLEECPIYLGFQKGQGIHRDDEIFWRKDGTSFPVEYWSHVMVQDGGSLCVVAFMDITARKQAEEALLKSEERWRAVFENSAIGVALTDLHGRFLAANHAYQKMLGYSEGELRRLTFLDVTHEDYNESSRALVSELIEGKREQFQIEKRYLRKDGSVIWGSTNVSLVPGTETMPKFIMGLAEDITKRKGAEEALRKSEERWRSVFENSAIGVALTNLNGRFLAVNHAYEKMLGYTEEELRKLTFLEVTHEDDRGSNWELINDLLEGKREQFQIEKQYRRKDGSLMWVSNNVSLVPGAESMPQFIMALSEDVTERKQAEDALRKSEERARTLLDINNAIVTNLAQETLLHSIFKVLRKAVPYDAMALMLHVAETGAFRIMAVEGIPRHFHAGQHIEHRGSSVGWVFDHQRPLLRRHLEKEQQFSNDAQLVADGMRSHCVVPLIIYGGKSIGTLNVASKRSAQYSEKDAEFLQEVANQVALAVENMKSYEEIAELKARLEKENVYLQEEIRTEHNFEEIVGNSPALLAVLQKVERVAPTDSTVLIYGETGTGKELIARAIHDRSARKDRPLVKVNCSAISAGLVESELFGHVKGAFTGALDRRTGRFELADGGTIFLDEVGDLPLETQVKLLRVLQEREFEPVGSSRPLRVNVRVIAATNRNLEETIQAGRFRSDLFYRLNVFPLEVPPLRERRPDIPKLAKFFLSNYSRKLGKNVDDISRDAMDRFLGYSWPGNVRELQNVIERAVVLSQGRILELQHELALDLVAEDIHRTAGKPPEEAQAASLPASKLPTLREVERSHILAALKITSGVIEGPKGAARILNLHPNTLRHRMEKFGIKRSDHLPS